MLRGFRLVNHRSFGNEQELSLLPAHDRDRWALPVAAIYGANASGKSNLLNGLAFMRSAVLESFEGWDAEGGVPRQPFRLDPTLRAQPSGYVVDVVTDQLRYTYGFALSDDGVEEEWLYSYPDEKKRVLFERTKLDLLPEITRPNALFLSVAGESGAESALPVRRWFRDGLIRRHDRRTKADVGRSACGVRYRHLGIRIPGSRVPGPAGGNTGMDRPAVGCARALESGATMVVDGATASLHSLRDFTLYEGENRERRYLGGSYGAVPVISALTPVGRHQG